VVAALADAGITDPFPIQELSLPMALSGADLIGQARTGTGKTLAFGIPLVQRVDPNAGYIQALVVVPTRELCLQVHDDLVIAGATRNVKVVAAYGGRAIDPQSEAIAAGAPIVVGTPGRLLDLVRRGKLDLARASMLVLDEADEMLDMGFLPDVEQLIDRCAQERQTLLFSATVPSEVVRLARRYMNKPTFMRSDVQQQSVAPQMRQFFFACHRLDKPAVVARILASPTRGRTLIFTRTKRMADVLADELRSRNIDAGVIHSDLRQEARERALVRFRKGTQDVLCATEVAARGLDIDQVTHVINYDCPDDERMYLHRIGRTGRAGAAGVAVTLAVWNELARLEMIKKALQIDDETHEVFSTSPLLDDLFGPALETPDIVTDGDGERETAQEPGDIDDGAEDRGPRAPTGRSRGGRRARRTRRRKRHDPVSPADAATREADTETSEPDDDHSDGSEPQLSTPSTTADADTSEEAAVHAPADADDDPTAPEPADSGTAAAGDDSATSSRSRRGGGNSSRSRGDRDSGRPRGDGDSGRPRDGDSGRPRDGDSGRPRDGDSGRPRGDGDSGRPRGDGDSGGTRGRRASKRSHDASEPVAELVSPASRAARGAGKPALNRPLEISHLP
jgi:superfamily II DNA/RNA helicase